jgi:hypothetical protein
VKGLVQALNFNYIGIYYGKGNKQLKSGGLS